MWRVVDVVVARGWLVAVQLVYVLVLHFLASEASSSNCDMCLPFRGCPVVLDIKRIVSA